jgi:hypothetical protein
MKRLLFILAITMATFCGLQAAQINEADARQVADQFFTVKSSRMMAPAGTAATTRLAYTAENGHFYVFERGEHGAFVIVAGDDRLPQVLGYGDKGDFTGTLPPAVQYWMNELNRQIAYLQLHNNVAAHQPAKRAAAVAPLLTTRWNQGEPYNNLCPTYGSDGNTSRAVTGCVATAMAQVMNYYEWPAVGRGSHSYNCNVNNMTPTQLTADFSQSVYRWDLMLDEYTPNSSEEECEAVARLMLDAGISVDMSYGSSSGASEADAIDALKLYFDYNDKCYLLGRDYFSVDEWEQLLVDELSAGRPILYCGQSNEGGHAFVLDGFNTDGYYHFNWGWGGYYDGYFLMSALNPGGTDFKYMNDGMFGVVPSNRANEVEDVLYVRGYLVPATASASLGSAITVKTEDLMFLGNKATGFDVYGDYNYYYVELPMSLAVIDSNGVERQHVRYTVQEPLGNAWMSSGRSTNITLLSTLGDGEYKIKLYYSLDGGQNFDQEVLNYNGQEVYVKMIVSDGKAYLYDCFLSNKYSVDSFVLSSGIMVNQPIDVDMTVSYRTWWSSSQGPLGNLYLSIVKDGTEEEVSTSGLYEVQLPANTPKTLQMQVTAPAEWGRYHVFVNDEDGNRLSMTPTGWSWGEDEAMESLFVLPICDALVEDFESMTANSSTSDKNVQGSFTTWSFTKSGVRAPGEGRCNGTNSVMLKKGSTFYTTQPLAHNFFMAQATFFNNAASSAKYTLEYSLDGAATWQKAYTIDGENAAEVPEKSETSAMWLLNLSALQPAQFRIAMIGGSTAATYVDDVVLYYIDTVGDVNADGEVGIADINALIDIILTSLESFPTADVNGDNEVNVADINALIDIILNR